MSHPEGSLSEYERKRDFARTSEPPARQARSETRPEASLRFAIQKHAARRLHYDLRLELDGTLKSWAVPRGPSLDPEVRALAVHVEDHPLEYGAFEGTIPEGQYGGGAVMLWDRGEWLPRGDPRAGYRRGKLRFELRGERLGGGWLLVRMGGRAGDEGRNWLLRKLDDDVARDEEVGRVTEAYDTSVETGRSLDEIARESEEDEGGEWAEGTEGSGRAPLPEPPASAPRASLPATLRPQLPSLVSDAPEGDDWVHELKFDGYRILSRVEGSRVSLMTRRGHDWSRRFPSVAEAIENLTSEAAILDGTILDGEVAVPAADGTTDFQALQNQMNRGDAAPVAYFVFDLPFYRGRDLRKVPLEERKRILRDLLGHRGGSGVIRYSDHIVGEGRRVAEHSCRHALEGIVAKRRDARYREGRGRGWVKVKCTERQEFVVGGWTDPSGSRQGFGALLLGWYDDAGRLVYSGRVGTGFSVDTLLEIRELLDPLERKTSPFEPAPTGAAARGVHWTDPVLVAEVAFTGWTEEGRLRHPSFLALRDDKEPREVGRERPVVAPQGDPPETETSRTKERQNPPPPANPGRADRVGGVQLTNADRVLYPEQGITKRDLALYYETVADWILPHLRDRPLSLVRCPRGRDEKCFFQKHLTEGMPEPVRGIEVGEADERALYVAVDDLPGLVSLVQFGVLEIHPWGSRGDRLERPDRIVFDLDPGEGVRWPEVRSAARALGALLADLGLETWLRTTGGKGLHVVVPIARRTGWEQVRAFARDVARMMERAEPARFVSTSRKAKREGKIYVDYLRNGRGATAIASYSTRARRGAPVAAPVRWDELSGLSGGDAYSVANMPARLRALGGDPWEGFHETRQTLTKRMLERVR